jgi:type II secretory pathway pseudopilin PulG
MINRTSSHHIHGFTLIETIIYIGLFGIMFTGIFVSIYPIFTSTDRLTKNITSEGEAAFILSKINYALSDTVTSSTGRITIPPEGSTTNKLILINDTEKYHFSQGTSGTFCAAPLICKQLLLSKDGDIATPLNASRISIENFKVKHVAGAGGAARYIEVSFTANGRAIGPVRYYVHF